MTRINQHLRQRLIDARAPRYTSYPPANRFSIAIGADDHREWLATLDPAASVSVYVHIPFCRRLCWFCACRTQGANGEAPLDYYLDTLEREVAMLAEALPGRLHAGALHLGGGTPTILTPSQMDRLKTMLDGPFIIDGDTSFSVEVDPCDVDKDRIAALAAAGMTRASIGVQDFDPDVQQRIGREQSFDVTAQAVEWLRAAGIDSLNMDLVYGLPGQTAAGLRRTLARALWLAPDRIALFGYAHVPRMSKRQILIDANALPGAEARLDLFEIAREMLIDAGYESIGIDHFAKPKDSLAVAAREGRLRRNFQGYTDDSAPVLIGLGASAISRLPQGYAQNAAATVVWRQLVDGGDLPVTRGWRMDAEDNWRAAAIERLMCDFRVDPADLHVASSLYPKVVEVLRRAAEQWPDIARINSAGVLYLVSDGATAARLVAQSLDAVSDTVDVFRSMAV